MNTSNDLAIDVRDCSKSYHIYNHPQDRFKQFIMPSLQQLTWLKPKQYYREFWALKDVSFKIKKGESVGIIGRNGSGKSTLLQMICGTVTPTGGSIQTEGRISALLELGSGFNPEFTGLENVYLNGSVLGLSKEEIDLKLDSILAFAEIGDFINQPIKTYSSGMLVRLAFAVQINVEPEILIVDEALSVGDFFFQQKCYAQLRKMQEEGLTLLFVSHDMGTVRDICSKVIYLRKGNVGYLGDTQEAIRRYLSEDTLINQSNLKIILKRPAEKNANDLKDVEKLSELALWKRDLKKLSSNHYLLAVIIRDEERNVVTSIKMGSKLIIQVFFRNLNNVKGNITIIFKNKFDQIVSSRGTSQMGAPSLIINSNTYGLVEFEFDGLLEAGLYSLMITFGILTLPNRGNRIDETDWFGPLQINWDYKNENAPFLGMFGLPGKVNVI